MDARTSERDIALKRARKLRALALDQAESPEGIAAQRMLDRLVGKWSLHEEELVEVDIQRSPLQRGSKEEWEILLVANLAEFYRCSSTHGPEWSMIYGEPEEAEAVRVAHRELADAIRKLWVAYDTKLAALQEEEEGTWSMLFYRATEHDYCMTAVSVVRTLLRAKRKPEPEEKEQGEKAALVPAGAALVPAGAALVETAKKQAEGARNLKRFEWIPDAEYKAKKLAVGETPAC